MTSLPSKYNPAEIEDKIYAFWLKESFFNANPSSSKPKFSIVIPPPNITGMLTLGHVLNNTLQDIIVRFKRMQGYDVLWQPGIDHAGIATQNVVEKALAKEGKTRFDLGREEFIKSVWKWKEEYGGTILLQLRKLGFSCDWSRIKFTMDEELSKAVIKAFVKLYEDGLIYRGTRIINWCPRCGTALSDEEVEYAERDGKLYFLKYPLVGEDGFVVVATTRPETYLGDTAVAVNPNDPRYVSLIGKKVKLPLISWERMDTHGRPVPPEIPIIASWRVESEFGTGAVKVTPAHDPVDFEIGEEYNLAKVQIMDTSVVMNDNAGIFAGLNREDARKRIVEKLDENGYVIKVEDYHHNVGTCYRCNTVVEPYLSPQWFVKIGPLADKAYKAVKDGHIRIIPEQFEKIYFNWLENVKDWCISRQIWWGHRIPVYICQECDNVMVQEVEPRVCSRCGSTNITQDEDVLDTWFSSWLWPFSTLGWPEDTEYLRKYYPTDLLVTGWDILFFWVARMVMAGYYFMNKEPFKRVYLHGLIRDEKRRKLSKSLGNSPDPLELVGKYGADGVRMGLLLITPEGQDVIYSEKKIELGRNFCNKLWNACRLLLMNCTEGKIDIKVEPIRIEDRWILHLLDKTISEITRALEEQDFNRASWLIYDFFWGKYCDWYLEAIKPRIFKRDQSAFQNVFYVLKNILQLLHPFMPFITEELWQKLPLNGLEESIMISKWPESGKFEFYEDFEDFETLKTLIQNVRQIKAEASLGDEIVLALEFSDNKMEKLLNENAELLEFLCGIKGYKKARGIRGIPLIVGNFHFIVPVDSREKIEKMVGNYRNEIVELEKHLTEIVKKLENEEFLKRAPIEVVEKEKEKKHVFELKIEKLREYIKGLEGEAA
ncbi:MAG: valine--tRNA ligase [Candidatus Hydrothermia bacterium]